MLEMTDIHCHILPKVDDGADSVEEARQMLRREYEDGVRTIIATPHYREGMFEPSMKRIAHYYEGMRKVAAKDTPGLRLYLGCEYHTNSRMTEDLRQRRRPTMVGSTYVLTEFSGAHNYEKIRNQVYELIAEGYKPIIAHIERYPCLQEDLERVRELIGLGARIQINAGAIMGGAGNKVKKFCRQVMEEDLLHFIASDAHGIKYRYPNLGECAKYVTKKMGASYAEKIFRENPEHILDDARKVRKQREGRKNLIERAIAARSNKKT